MRPPLPPPAKGKALPPLAEIEPAPKNLPRVIQMLPPEPPPLTLLEEKLPALPLAEILPSNCKVPLTTSRTEPPPAPALEERLEPPPLPRELGAVVESLALPPLAM